MSTEMRGFVALVVGCLVGFLTRRWTKNRKSKKTVFIEKAKRAGHCVTGEYESSKVFPGIRDSNNPRLRDDSLEVKYKYTVAGKDYYKRIMFQSRGRVGTDFPIRVNVYYNPTNPKKAVCPEEAHPSQQIQSGCLTTILFTFLSMIATLYILGILI